MASVLEAIYQLSVLQQFETSSKFHLHSMQKWAYVEPNFASVAIITFLWHMLNSSGHEACERTDSISPFHALRVKERIKNETTSFLHKFHSLFRAQVAFGHYLFPTGISSEEAQPIICLGELLMTLRYCDLNYWSEIWQNSRR